ncbi:MAG: hypothetical protein WAV45_01295 [Propionibacteriaceae bacterium]|nr:hypothetical protein [Micropruina sp.]HBX80719.1 hypothetical protein [Propionibacteriaceae bacterium]HBY23785.1 hypothetical protein [Propionibacteriaceae bacterium]
MDGLNSNLNLNAGVPPTVQPRLGEWGPVGVPPTRKKKRMRWIVSIAFVVSLGLLCAYGYWQYTLMR